MAVCILGIESSCDETAAAVVDDSGSILSSVVASQLAAHARYGGVVPEIASREHGRAIVPVVRAAMDEAGLIWTDLAAIAVTVVLRPDGRCQDGAEDCGGRQSKGAHGMVPRKIQSHDEVGAET